MKPSDGAAGGVGATDGGGGGHQRSLRYSCETAQLTSAAMQSEKWLMGRDCETSVARQPVSFYLSGETAEAQERHRDRYLKATVWTRRRMTLLGQQSQVVMTTDRRHKRRGHVPRQGWSSPAFILFPSEPGVVTFDSLWFPGHGVALDLQLSVSRQLVQPKVKGWRRREARELRPS